MLEEMQYEDNQEKEVKRSIKQLKDKKRRKRLNRELQDYTKRDFNYGNKR